MVDHRIEGFLAHDEEDHLGAFHPDLQAKAAGADGVEGGVAPLAGIVAGEQHCIAEFGAEDEPGLDQARHDQHGASSADAPVKLAVVAVGEEFLDRPLRLFDNLVA